MNNQNITSNKFNLNRSTSFYYNTAAEARLQLVVRCRHFRSFYRAPVLSEYVTKPLEITSLLLVLFLIFIAFSACFSFVLALTSMNLLC